MAGMLAQSASLRSPGFLLAREPRQPAKVSAGGSSRSLGRSASAGALSLTMTRNRATNRAWVGKDAAARCAGVEITKWTPLSKPVTTTQQADFVPNKPVPARPADWTKKIQPRSDTTRMYGDVSSHLADYHPWPDSRRKASIQAGRDPVEARGGTFAGVTTTADSYKPPLHGPRHIPYQSINKPYEARFANYASTYNLSYLPFECEPAPSMKPPVLSPVRAGGKTGKSSYAEEYFEKPLNPKVVPWQNLERRKLPAGSSGHTGSSTHNADFIEHPTREVPCSTSRETAPHPHYTYTTPSLYLHHTLTIPTPHPHYTLPVAAARPGRADLQPGVQARRHGLPLPTPTQTHPDPYPQPKHPTPTLTLTPPPPPPSPGTGGRFQLMIPAGSAAPTQCEMSFTTVVDAQQLAQIVVVARQQGEVSSPDPDH